MVQLVVSPEAQLDLLEIWSCIARDSEANADRMYARLEHTFQEIGASPGIGTGCGHVARGVRKLPVGNYVIYSMPERERVVIARVIHGKRRQKKAFREGR